MQIILALRQIFIRERFDDGGFCPIGRQLAFGYLAHQMIQVFHAKAGGPFPVTPLMGCYEFYALENAAILPKYSCQRESTCFFVSASISISSGHSRLKPSVFHFLVASMPTLLPKAHIGVA